MTSRHWGILNQWTDGWEESDGLKVRQEMDGWTDRLIKLVAKKLYQIIFNLRTI